MTFRLLAVLCAIGAASGTAAGWAWKPQIMHQHPYIFGPIGIVSTLTGVALLILWRRLYGTGSQS